jgi:Zn-dependent peptidase ImmA (M78 family)
VVFVPELPRTLTYGATRWLGDRALIQLSLRYKSNDHLWFTFFHEAGHIVLHGRKDIFIETKGIDDTKEKEADEFARDILIPPDLYERFISQGNFSAPTIQRFAHSIGIAPGIVVGRLQYDKVIPYSQGNKLKVHISSKFKVQSSK